MKNHNKLTVSVGIAAYNEEKNIANVLRDVLSQKQKNWVLKEILVYSDGSDDETVKKAKSLSSTFINVIDDQCQKGKAYRVEQIYKCFQGDILVMFDADVKLANNLVIENLLKHFNYDPNIVLVGGNSRPFKPKTFFERAVYTTFLTLDKSRVGLKNGNNIYGCSGQCLALKKGFAKSISFPVKVINEDDYLYFSCLKQNKIFQHCRKAIVYYKLPKFLGDYLRQVFRADPDASISSTSRYFGNIVKKEYHRPLKFYVSAISKSFFYNPLGVVYMILVRILSKPFIPTITKHYKYSWFTANSTK